LTELLRLCEPVELSTRDITPDNATDSQYQRDRRIKPANSILVLQARRLVWRTVVQWFKRNRLTSFYKLQCNYRWGLGSGSGSATSWRFRTVIYSGNDNGKSWWTTHLHISRRECIKTHYFAVTFEDDVAAFQTSKHLFPPVCPAVWCGSLCTMQVQAIDMLFLQDLRQRYPASCAHLVTTSPVLRLTSSPDSRSAASHQPVIILVPVPPSPVKRQPTPHHTGTCTT